MPQAPLASPGSFVGTSDMPGKLTVKEKWGNGPSWSCHTVNNTEKHCSAFASEKSQPRKMPAWVEWVAQPETSSYSNFCSIYYLSLIYLILLCSRILIQSSLGSYNYDRKKEEENGSYWLSSSSFLFALLHKQKHKQTNMFNAKLSLK